MNAGGQGESPWSILSKAGSTLLERSTCCT